MSAAPVQPETHNAVIRLLSTVGSVQRLKQNLVLDVRELALLALACGEAQPPGLTVEAFGNWLAQPLSEEAAAVRHGAKMLLAEAYLSSAITGCNS